MWHGRRLVRQAAQAVAQPLAGVGCARWLLLPASRFKHILEDVGDVCLLYGSHPLARLPPAKRGNVLQDVVRGVLSQRFGEQAQSPEPELDINGRLRRRGAESYDFALGGRRIECKSAQLYWDRSVMAWMARFRNIKLNQDLFDDLYLALYSPDSLLILQHDLRTRMYSQGRLSEERGYAIQLRSGRNLAWKEGLEDIVQQLLCPGSNCQLIAMLSVPGPEVAAALERAEGGVAQHLTKQAYEGTPLQYASPTVRGLRVEAVAFDIDKLLNPDASFLRTCKEKSGHNSLKGLHSASADWLRDTCRIEVKHSRMSFNQTHQYWRCMFSDIKFASVKTGMAQYFDELWLAVFSPRGLHFFKHKAGFGMPADTAHARCAGGRIYVYGPKKQPDVNLALERILVNLCRGGCEPVATVQW